MRNVSEPESLVREFRSDLLSFGDLVGEQGRDVFREAAQTTAKAIVFGNAFGPGAPLDTGFLRASFRVSLNTPEDGPSVGAKIAGRKDGDAPLYPTNLDTSGAARAQLGDDVFITTMAAYAVDLEEGSGVRRNGPSENIGTPTPFIAPVEFRFDAIVEDAARRVGYGA